MCTCTTYIEGTLHTHVYFFIYFSNFWKVTLKHVSHYIHTFNMYVTLARNILIVCLSLLFPLTPSPSPNAKEWSKKNLQTHDSQSFHFHRYQQRSLKLQCRCC